MRRWWWVAVLLGGGCNQIFGVRETQLVDASDAEVVQVVIDGPGSLTLDLPNVQPSAPTDDPIAVALSVHGPANADVVIATTASGGVATPAQTTVPLDGNGLGQTSVTYTTPSAAGDVTVTFAASTGSLTAQQSIDIAVHALQSYGYDTSSTLGSGDMMPKDKALGVRIRTPAGAPLTVEEVGFWASSVVAGTHAKWGLYTDTLLSPSKPVMLLATVPSSAVANGKNFFPLPQPVVLSADTNYWLVGVYDQGVTIPYNGGSSVLEGIADFPFATAMPATWSATWLTNAAADSYFLRGAQ